MKDCFDSLRLQTFRDFNVLMVDNGSTDDSVEFTRLHYPEVKIISLPKNAGFSAGVNAGIKAADEEFVALLNNDTKVDPAWLEELYKGITSDERIGFCASKMLFFHFPDLINSAGDLFYVDGRSENRGFKEKDSAQYNMPFKTFSACAGAALYRRALFDSVGLFDEDFFCLFEDIDLSFRSQLAAYECLYVPTAVVYHVHTPTVIKLGSLLTRNFMRNRLFVLIKNMPSRLLLKHFLKIIACHAFLTLNILLNGKYNIEDKKAVCRAHWEVLTSFGTLLRKRKEIQSRKKVTDTYIESIITPCGIKDYLRIFTRKTR